MDQFSPPTIFWYPGIQEREAVDTCHNYTADRRMRAGETRCSRSSGEKEEIRMKGGIPSLEFWVGMTVQINQLDCIAKS